MKYTAIILMALWALGASAQCDTTINNAVSSITTTSATISTGTISGATNYRLVYVRVGFTDTVRVDGASNIKAVSGLSANMQYRYYFIVTCGSGSQRGQRGVYTFRTTGSAIQYTPMTAAGYDFKYGSFDSAFHLPNLSDTTLLRGKIRPGAMVMVSGQVYSWDGVKWSLLAGGGSGGGGSWQDALAVGNMATTLPVINRSFLSSALRFVNPANNRQVDILPGTGSDSLRTLTLPNKGGRIALWTPRTQCINDSLFAWDESGVRQFTGSLCVTSQGSAIVRAHNGLEVLGDSSVGIRQGAYGTGAMIYFDSVNAAFSAGWNPRLGVANFGSVALGNQNTAAGETSVALGGNNQVNNAFGVAIGSNNVVNEDGGVAIGQGNEVSTNGNGIAIAIGEGNKAVGQQSLALSGGTIADQFAMTSMGFLNDTTGNAANQTLFQIGNGEGSTRSSIFTIGRDYMQFKHSTRANGYVLTSDANGVATWQPPSGGGADSSVFFTNFRADTSRANMYNTFIKTGDNASLRSLHVTGTNGAGNLLLRHQANPSNATGQTSALFADNSGNLAWQNANLSRLTFTANHFTANHAIRFQNKNYTVADSAVVLNRADSNLYVTTHDYNVRKDSVLSLLDTRATSATNNGLTTKVWARGQGIESITSSLSLATGSHQTTYFDILTPTTLNGVAYFQTVAGNYTPNNYNGIAIHRYDVANDTAYLIASSANNGTLWQAAANQWVSVPFTAPVVVQPGPYRVTLYYSSSIQTAAPQVSGATNVSGFVVFVLPNTGRLSGRLTQTTPADFKTSTLGGNNGQPILRIY
jgi:hypothetical protein